MANEKRIGLDIERLGALTSVAKAGSMSRSVTALTATDLTRRWLLRARTAQSC
jgi:hypothetical protein